MKSEKAEYNIGEARDTGRKQDVCPYRERETREEIERKREAMRRRRFHKLLRARKRESNKNNSKSKSRSNGNMLPLLR